MIQKLDSKDPDDEDFFTFYFSARLLAGETITSADTVIVGPDSALVRLSQATTDTVVTVRLGGGTLHQTYVVRCRVQTTLGRPLDLSFSIQIEED
jgi:hypothetical protein